MNDNNQIAEIKERLDIVQVIEKYLPLKQTGKNFVGICPFHKEKTPSFIVSPDIQRYKCFGCNASGDIFNFVQNIENLDFPETLEKLANMAGVELRKFKVNTKYKTLEEINYIATKYYFNQLKKNKKALEYIKNRGFTDESIKLFGIGYAPSYPNGFLRKKYLKKYSEKELVDSGVFSLKDGVVKEKFRDRIMFPIRSKRGAVIGFTGRILPDNKWGPKYLNTPETLIFHKKDNLFAQYESKQEIRKLDIAIICEGSTDVISAHQHGYKNIVAPLGTSLTIEQLESLSNLTNNILFFFDSDEAGQTALIRGFKLSSSLGMNPYATNSKPFKDIDEMMQKDPKRMQKLLDNKVEAFSYILADVIKDKDLNKLEDINKIKAVIEPILESVKDENAKALYIRKYSNITKIRHSVSKSKKNLVKREEKTYLQKDFLTKDNLLYSQYFQLLFLVDELKDWYMLKKKYLKNTEFEKIYEIILKNFPKIDKEYLYSQFENNSSMQNILEQLIFQMNERVGNMESIEEEIKKIQKNIKIKYYIEKQKSIMVQIAMNEEMKEGELHFLKKLDRISKILKKLKNEK